MRQSLSAQAFETCLILCPPFKGSQRHSVVLSCHCCYKLSLSRISIHDSCRTVTSSLGTLNLPDRTRSPRFAAPRKELLDPRSFTFGGHWVEAELPDSITVTTLGWPRDFWERPWTACAEPETRRNSPVLSTLRVHNRAA